MGEVQAMPYLRLIFVNLDHTQRGWCKGWVLCHFLRQEDLRNSISHNLPVDISNPWSGL
jgi:hypothetical protein